MRQWICTFDRPAAHLTTRHGGARLAMVGALAMGLIAGVAAFTMARPGSPSRSEAAAAPVANPAAPANAAAQDTLYYGSKVAKAKAPGTIRLGSYNIENLFDEDDNPAISGSIDDASMTKPVEQRRAAAAAIKALDADVLCLQEIESEAALKWFRDQHLQGLGYDHVASLDAGDGRGIEQSVLSRYPIKTVKNWVGAKLDTPRPASDSGRPDPRAGEPMKFARSPLFVEVEIPAETAGGVAGDPAYMLSLIVLHHKSGRNFDAQREAEARKVIELYHELEKEHPGRNIAIVGDFNATPEAASFRTYIDAGMIDPFAVRSKAPASDRTWVTHASGRVIDFILVSPELAPEVVDMSAFVLATPSRAPGSDYRRTPEPQGYASDHMPIAIDITPKEAPAAKGSAPKAN